MQKVVISQNLPEEIIAAYNSCEHDKTFILCDDITRSYCLPLVESVLTKNNIPYTLITIPAGDDNKTVESISHVWEALSHGGATRHSLLINVAGGMVTDLGGFAAATFKRGINFINVPTTLLSQVDASVGGKTGINFCGYKNEIGAFCNASTVIISSEFLRTLDMENLLSGYAEMLKHSLLKDDTMLREHLAFDFSPFIKNTGNNTNPHININYARIQEMVAQSITVKQAVVEADPKENGLRKALNLGHTVGHAFESLAMTRQPILHGYAVAYGLVCELFLSSVRCGFPSDKLHQVASFVKENYGKPAVTCDDYPTLIELMTHDKKNHDGMTIFTLLGDCGDIRINQTATKQEIEDAFDFLLF